MENIRISENVKMYVEHPIFGRVPIPIEKVTIEPRGASTAEPVLVHFTKHTAGERHNSAMVLNIGWAMHLVAQHVEEQNRQADDEAKRKNQPLGRYKVEDMCVEEIIFDDGKHMHLYCTWRDCYDTRRMYCSARCKVGPTAYDENRLYAHHTPPTFYF